MPSVMLALHEALAYLAGKSGFRWQSGRYVSRNRACRHDAPLWAFQPV